MQLNKNVLIVNWLKRYTLEVIFFILLTINFLIRVDAFRQPYYYDVQDWSRSYLTAHHIVHFGEFTLAPINIGTPIGAITGSPFYFYFLAAQLLIKDDILLIGWVNLFSQVLNLILVYFLARYMFGRNTAFIASVIFGFSENILKQSDALWAPHSMQPFLNLSYLLLLIAYLKNSYFSLLFSIILFLISQAIHSSALGIIPAYSFLAFIVLKRGFRNSKIYYVYTLITIILTILLLYFPRFYSNNNIIQSSSFIDAHSIIRLINNPMEILNSFYMRVETLLKFFLVKGNYLQTFNFLSLVTIVMVIIYLLRMRDKFNQKPFFLVLCWTIIQFLFLSSFIKSNYPNDPFPSYYLTPILSIFAILIAEAVNNLLANRAILNFFKVLFIVFFLYVSSPNLSNSLRSIIYKLSNETIGSFFYIPYQIHPAIEAIKSEIMAIKTQEKINDFNFFQLRGYRIINDYVYDYKHIAEVTLFLTHLEIGLDAKLTKTIDAIEPNFEQLGSDRYIFLICPSRTSSDNPDKCLNIFLKNYSSYDLVKNIFNSNDYKVYLAKKA